MNKEELEKCKSDFQYFVNNYCKVVDKKGNLIPIYMTDAQKRQCKLFEYIQARYKGSLARIVMHSSRLF